MEIVLMIIAGFVVYYLYITFQEYLKNPLRKDKEHQAQKRNIKSFLKKQDNQENEADQSEIIEAQVIEEKTFEKSELGVILSIIKIIPNAKDIEDIQTKLSDLIISNYFALPYLNKTLKNKESVKEFWESSDSKDILDLSKDLLNITYGEYKKRLKLVEFFTMILYIDSNLNEKKNEFLLDIASSLELENSDFKEIYDRFENEFQDPKPPKNIIEDLNELMPNIFNQELLSANFINIALNLREIFQNPSVKVKKIQKKKEVEDCKNQEKELNSTNKSTKSKKSKEKQEE